MITEEIKTLLRAIADGKQMQHKPKGIDCWWTDTAPEYALVSIAAEADEGSQIEVRSMAICLLTVVHMWLLLKEVVMIRITSTSLTAIS